MRAVTGLIGRRKVSSTIYTVLIGADKAGFSLMVLYTQSVSVIRPYSAAYDIHSIVRGRLPLLISLLFIWSALSDISIQTVTTRNNTVMSFESLRFVRAAETRLGYE